MGKEKTKRHEVDLYEPIEHYFTKQGYNVHGEVNHCDLAALKGDELLIVELKLTLNVELLIQATKRQRLTEFVYIAIPTPAYSLRSKKWKDICHLMRRLELGLITVSFREDDTEMKIIHEPGPFDKNKSRRQSTKKRNGIFTEIEGRQGNYNVGGSTQTKIMTAYKENCIHIACCLEHFGPLTPKSLRQMGTGEKTLAILTKNYNGWFEKIRRGVYGITEKGVNEFKENPQIADFYIQSMMDSSSYID
ncbi:DUF2161 domain-containing phosphodiesterase [Sporosarcina limicola]|uniref:Uncharacterized protein n=1 Tax=Sporosarcina limicola TaxID=34101 RepID=A0A927MMI1_9BACL|nr:DUF2161 family putative PD-(D/E)XK-type phosphodiesterase [Sporosarcina limicola]MBE1556693.1 hypothetical protein [Sporosarcina limicola]